MESCDSKPQNAPTSAAPAEAGVKSAKMSKGISADKHLERIESTELGAGATITVTIGKEVFWPVKHNGFEVGPISVAITVGTGESARDAYVRARTVAATMFEAEFELRRVQFFNHLECCEDPKAS